jgi:GTP pyrophosphokinase
VCGSKGVRQLLRIGAIAVTQADVSESSKSQAAARHEQVEALRKMLLAFAQDIRVVLVRLASRLQTLRWLAQTKTPRCRAWRAKRSTSMRRWPTGSGSGR